MTCLAGAIVDAAVDLRTGSPTYHQSITVRLDAAQGTLLYLPSGIAHGFQVIGDHADVLYKVSAVYAPAHDAGIRWDSAGIAWPNMSPIVSARDAAFPAMRDFDSPFSFGS